MAWTAPTGYRLITTDDVGKVFGTDLESIVYFNTDVSYLGHDSGEGESILATDTFELSYYDMDDFQIRIWLNGLIIIYEGSNWLLTEYDFGTSTITEVMIDDYYYNTNCIYVKDIEVETFTLTYNSNGGSTHTASVIEDELVPTLPTPTKSGYTFKGWYYDNTTFANVVTKDDDITADKTIYAKWDSNTYKVLSIVENDNFIGSK